MWGGKGSLLLGLVWGAIPAWGATVTFAHDVAPIVYRRCVACHRAGEAGPFPLIRYQDVKKHAGQIAAVTRSGFMPPWLPEAGYGDFKGERRLSPDEIQTLADWVSQGAPEGLASETPPPPQFQDGWQLGAPDVILDAAEPVSIPASGPDVFWNFVFTPALKTRRFVRAVEIRPGDRRVVHHANLLIDRMASVRGLEAERGKGFAGMDLTIARSPFDPDGHFLFWKPGGAPLVEPDGLAWRLDPGDELILNTHLHPSGKPEQVRPSIGLYFTDVPQTRFPLLIQLEHDGAIDIPPGDSDFMVSDDFRLPMDCDVLAVYPHAHYLGNLLEAYATLPDGERKWLIRIPAWDLNWQAVFEYREPLFLPQGSVISMRYHYDNSAANVRNPNQPPRRVENGNQSSDEMGHLWLQVLPRGPHDRRLELQEAVMEHRLEKYPDDFTAHLNLGAILLARLNVSGGVNMLEQAVRIEPQRPEAHNMLGAGFARMGRIAEAMEEFQIALKARPDFANARLNLANALVRAHKFEEAITDYRQVLAEDPGDEVAEGRLADALEARADQLAGEGRTAEASAMQRESEAIRSALPAMAR
jgi:tetratricopeptide (TPR) repeat protein